MAADANPPSVQTATNRAPTRDQLDFTEPAVTTAGENPVHVLTGIHAKTVIPAATVSMAAEYVRIAQAISSVKAVYGAMRQNVLRRTMRHRSAMKTNALTAVIRDFASAVQSA